MNASRRKRLADIKSKLTAIKDILEDIIAEEENALDNLPDGLRDSSKGEKMQEAIDSMEECGEKIDEINELIDEI